MTNFKFTCPYCGQRIICDSAQGGSVMTCPTCYQKLVAPQAPNEFTPNLVLTGKKYVEKQTAPIPTIADSNKRSRKSFPFSLVVMIVGLLITVGAAYLIFHSVTGSRVLTWQTTDIGNVGVPGSFNQANNVFSISGAGADIWYQADAFHFVFVPQPGDGTITTRVLNLQNTDPWAKAGLMIRESLNPDSRYVQVFVSPTSGVAFQQRSSTGGPAASIVIADGFRTPCWLRLSRHKTDFTAYRSDDGVAWVKLGSTAISMEPGVQAGLVVCSCKAGVLCTAQFDQVTVTK